MAGDGFIARYSKEYFKSTAKNHWSSQRVSYVLYSKIIMMQLK